MPQYYLQTSQTWTTAELLEAVKDEAALPDSSRITDADILRTADQAIASILSEPLIRSLAFGGRSLDYIDTRVSDGFVNGSEFFLPTQAASGDISHTDYVRSDGTFYRLNQIEASDSVYYQQSGNPTHYFFRGSRVVLAPKHSSIPSGDSVRIWFPTKHPKLIVETGNTLFTSLLGDSSTTAGTGSVSTASALAGTAIETANVVDIYSAYAPHAPLMSRLVIEDTSPSAFDFSGGPPNTADYATMLAGSAAKVSVSGTSDCVQLPSSFRKALTCLTASYLLGQIGDTAEANRLLGVFGNELQSLKNSTTPRSKGPSPIQKNRRSYSRMKARGWVR